MKVTRELGSRTLSFTELPDKRLTDGEPNAVRELEIHVNYSGEGSGRKGIVLDNVIVPAIVNAINAPAAVAIHLNAGLSRNGNGRRAYLVLASSGTLLACILDDGRGVQCLRDKFPGLSALIEIKTTPAEIKQFVKHCEAAGE